MYLILHLSIDVLRTLYSSIVVLKRHYRVQSTKATELFPFTIRLVLIFYGVTRYQHMRPMAETIRPKYCMNCNQVPTYNSKLLYFQIYTY